LILALDLSLTGSALILLDKGIMQDFWFFTQIKKQAKHKQAIFLSKEISEYERLEVITDTTLDIIRNRGNKIKFAAIEGYSFGVVGKTSRILQTAEFTGHIKKYLYSSRIPFRIYPPDRIKLFATGNGNATKGMMMVAVLKRWEKIDFSQFGKSAEDLADAYSIGQLLTWELKVKRMINQNKKPRLNAAEKKILYHKTKSFPIPLLEQSLIVKRE